MCAERTFTNSPPTGLVFQHNHWSNGLIREPICDHRLLSSHPHHKVTKKVTKKGVTSLKVHKSPGVTLGGGSLLLHQMSLSLCQAQIQWASSNQSGPVIPAASFLRPNPRLAPIVIAS